MLYEVITVAVEEMVCNRVCYIEDDPALECCELVEVNKPPVSKRVLRSKESWVVYPDEICTVSVEVFCHESIAVGEETKLLVHPCSFLVDYTDNQIPIVCDKKSLKVQGLPVRNMSNAPLTIPENMEP